MPIPGLRVVAVEDGHADWIRLGPDQDPETSHQHTRVDMLHIGDHIRTAATIYQCNRRAHTWRCNWRDVTVRQRRDRTQHRGEDRELGMRVASGLHPHSLVAELTGNPRPPLQPGIVNDSMKAVEELAVGGRHDTDVNRSS